MGFREVSASDVKVTFPNGFTFQSHPPSEASELVSNFLQIPPKPARPPLFQLWKVKKDDCVTGFRVKFSLQSCAMRLFELLI